MPSTIATSQADQADVLAPRPLRVSICRHFNPPLLTSFSVIIDGCQRSSFIAAYYCLDQKLSSNPRSVLIGAGAGALGQALVPRAGPRWFGCQNVGGRRGAKVESASIEAAADPGDRSECLRPQARRTGLLHAHFGMDAIEAVPIARSLGVPMVVTLHGFDINIDFRWWRGGHADLDARVSAKAFATCIPATRALCRGLGCDQESSDCRGDSCEQDRCTITSASTVPVPARLPGYLSTPTTGVVRG